MPRSVTGGHKGPGDRPPHLPEPPADPEGYNRLYAFNDGTDDYLEDEAAWKEIRIPPGLSADEVYRLLPSAPAFEYGGYLTKARIRYAACDPTRAGTLCSRPCTFHSHPAGLPGIEADTPSVSDVYSFLKYRHLRAVTVGKALIWVWDKTPATLETVARLAAWEAKYLVREADRLIKKHPHGWERAYMRAALKALGVAWPRSGQKLDGAWPEMLREGLKSR